jgi:L-asparaginase II
MNTTPLNPALVHVFRGASVESIHRGSISVSFADGQVGAELGNVDHPVFVRSTIKLFQAIPLIESGTADAMGLTDRELAVACASHDSQIMHVAAVRSILDKAGLDENKLLCGTHWPLSLEETVRIAHEGRKPIPIENNCSGKHAAFLAVCRHEGYDVGSYQSYEHPLQVRIRQALAESFDALLDNNQWAIDGCGVPTYKLSLRKLALGFAQLSEHSRAAADHKTARLRLLKACLENPEYVAGTLRFCTLQMKQVPGTLFLKAGAEGLFCGAFPALGIGFAIKCDDGAIRASTAVAGALIESIHHGERQRTSVDRNLEIRDGNGRRVGSIEPTELLTEFCARTRTMVARTKNRQK